MSDQANTTHDLKATRPSLDEAVEAFETIWNRDGHAELIDFLPRSDHPDLETIALELLCVDLERRWKAGNRKSVEEYLEEFPELLARGQVLERLAYEEFRMLMIRGEQASPAEFAQRLDINTDLWPVTSNLPPGETVAREAFADGIVDEMQRISGITRALPEIGEIFLRFKIVQLLGECKFGKVYLASQNDLANRLVVIKVTTNLWSESEQLAKLQHTNVVPIYSVHPCDGLQAVCMPYLGRVTLHDLIPLLNEQIRPSGETFVELLQQGLALEEESPGIRIPKRLVGYLASLTFEELCVWIISRVAGGLAHAHERGILHRDLKPANILITDAGEPMILDFNLSEDVIAGGRSSLLIGGTLPYMAPEHLRAAMSDGKVDVRSDIYSLGVMLFQLLTGRLPTPMQDGSIIGSLSMLIQEREGSKPSVRARNPRLSLAVESIVQKCLEFDPSKRYQTARALQEDLDAQLQHRVLRYARNLSMRERVRKWARRHPRASSAVIVFACCLCVSAVALTFLVRVRKLEQYRAVSKLVKFEAIAPAALVPLSFSTSEDLWVYRSLENAQRALSLYPVQPGWRDGPDFRWLDETQQSKLVRSIQQLNFLGAGALQRQASLASDAELRRKLLERAVRCNAGALAAGDPYRSLLLQRADLERQLGHDTAEEYKRRAKEVEPRDPRDRLMLALECIRDGQYRESKKILLELRQDTPGDLVVWFVLGISHYGAKDYAGADTCFSSCIALWPDYQDSYFHRGVSRLRAKRYADAEMDFTHVLDSHPDALANRALARIELGRLSEAAVDLTRMIDGGQDDCQTYLLRSSVWKRLGDSERAEGDRQQGLSREPTNADGWISRASARLPNELLLALDDLEQALTLQPRSPKALQNKAFILVQLKRHEDAIQTLSQLIDIDASNAAARVARGVLHAHVGNRTAALEDARCALEDDSSPKTRFQVARTLAQTSTTHHDDASEAMVLLGEAVRGDMSLARKVAGDSLFDPLRSRSDFQELLHAISLLVDSH